MAIRNEEAFTAFTLLFVQAAACATAMSGLSLTLGAFLAGLAYPHALLPSVQTEMAPFRSLLLSFFFISVGLSIDVPALLRNLPLVLLAAGGLIGLKTALGFAAARLNGWSVPGADADGLPAGAGIRVHTRRAVARRHRAPACPAR